MRTHADHHRVLVIDDEPIVGEVISAFLQEDHEVVVVTSAAAAKATLERDQAFAAILCDLMLPDMSGLELYRWLAGRLPQLAPLVIFMSGYAAAAEIAGTPDLTPLLEKPFEEDALRAVLSRLPEGS